MAAEVIVGYVVDIACLRRYPPDLAGRAAAHTKSCATMGYCIESGYGVVALDGTLTLLEDHATPRVVQALLPTNRDAKLRVRVTRDEVDGEMRTSDVRLVP